MRKFLLTLVFGVSALSLLAQIPVSTTPANKNVILEEFTGIHCGYCPDGHKIAQQIMTNNPGRAFMIAIHQGSYATPAAGEPDYRTPWGDAIAGQTGLTGYPAGTVNRHVFAGHGMTAGGTAMSRSNWTGDAGVIIGQPSYLNVGVSANLDYNTRVLTIQCQVYYTANSSVTTNRLNIALLQNNVKGPQSGSSANPTMVTPDGQYLHQHMLRHLFTGQWGVTINNTNSASGILKVDTTFTYTVPNDYNSVPVNLAELEVVAFVAEGNQEIISGSHAYVNPPAVDASVIAITGLPVIHCSTNGITPSVEIKNKGANVLTSAVINYSVDNGTPVTQNWTGSLATGATEVVAITNPITPINGHHTIKCYTTMPNGVADMNSVNDEFSGVYNVFSVYSATPVNEQFTSTTFPPTDWVVDGKGWSRSTTSSFGSGSGSAKMDFYNTPSGGIGDLYVYGLDFTSGTGHYLSFDHAYAQYSSENDRLQVQVSTNCGTSWNDLFNKAGTALKTANATTSSFTPSATQWASNMVDMSAFDGQSNLIIRFHATSAYGNNLYVDKVMTGIGFGINESAENTISVYPNPASDFINICNAENSVAALYDVYGKLISSTIINQNNYTLNTTDLATGNYILKLTNGDKTISKKISIVR